MFMSYNSITTHVTIVENLLITLPEYMSSSPVFSVVDVALTLVLCIVFCFFKLFLWLTPLKQIFCDNTIEKQLVELELYISFHGILLFYFQCLIPTNWWHIYTGLPRIIIRISISYRRCGILLFFILLWFFYSHSNSPGPTYSTHWTSFQLTIN
jgi:hypothetical protein